MPPAPTRQLYINCKYMSIKKRRETTKSNKKTSGQITARLRLGLELEVVIRHGKHGNISCPYFTCFFVFQLIAVNQLPCLW